jgi:hypothetical protein
MGQPITVEEKSSATPGIVRFELNRSLTGMGHERYPSRESATKDRIVDELARRLFDTGKVGAVHIYSNVVTVDLAKGMDATGLGQVIHDLFIYYTPGVVPPSDEELIAQVEG